MAVVGIYHFARICFAIWPTKYFIHSQTDMYVQFTVHNILSLTFDGMKVASISWNIFRAVRCMILLRWTYWGQNHDMCGRDEFVKLFDHPSYLSRLRSCTLRGVVNTRRFRSLCWSVGTLFLFVLWLFRHVWKSEFTVLCDFKILMLLLVLGW